MHRLTHLPIIDLDPFIVHGFYTVSNAITYEVQISDCGTSARLRFGEDVSPWIEITYELQNYGDDFDPSEGEDNWAPIINLWGGVPLNQVSRIQK